MNQKKLEMAYKRYRKNFVDGIKFEDVKDDYHVSQRKIENIVEHNETTKDHILLINVSRIFDYYLSLWKNDVLISGGDDTEGLKNMQKIVFYQCMGQDLYKIKYPKMMLRYTFRKVVFALVHFAMYGWEKEEQILYDFMVDHFDDHLINANEENRHVWFLLELYLQYRDKTILGTNGKLHLVVKNEYKETERPCYLIPEDLNVYDEVLRRWSTPDLEEVEHLVSNMAHYHAVLASEIGQLGEFGDFTYAFYPIDLLFFIYVRKQRGLLVPAQIDHFLMNTPEGRMPVAEREPYPKWDPLLQMIDQFYRKNYPDYIPNKHGELF